MQAFSLILALIALALAGYAVWRIRSQPSAPPSQATAEAPADVQALRAEVADLRGDLDRALRHLSVVRYDAFDDVGGRQSWSAAILDDEGSGVLLTSIQGRSEGRTYAKGVREWTSDLALSPEEESAIRAARPR